MRKETAQEHQSFFGDPCHFLFQPRVTFTVPVTEPYEELSEWTVKLRMVKRKLPDKHTGLLDEMGFGCLTSNAVF